MRVVPLVRRLSACPSVRRVREASEPRASPRSVAPVPRPCLWLTLTGLGAARGTGSALRSLDGVSMECWWGREAQPRPLALSRAAKRQVCPAITVCQWLCQAASPKRRGSAGRGCECSKQSHELLAERWQPGGRGQSCVLISSLILGSEGDLREGRSEVFLGNAARDKYITALSES